MKVVFLGVGEAFDENYPNNSALVLGEKTSLMIDCGDSAVRQLWKYISKNNLDFNFPDALYITHRHSDHLLGLPALLGRFNEEGRKKQFTIICTNELKKDIELVAEYSCQGLKTNFPFKLNFLIIKSDKTFDFNEFKLSFACLAHSITNNSIKITDNRNSVCYSGDGPYNEKSLELYKNADLVIHEAYLLNRREEGHECIIELIKIAKENNIKNLSFVHLNKYLRKNEEEKILEIISKENKASNVRFLLPNPFDEIDLS
jgi:ribonuclease Z